LSTEAHWARKGAEVEAALVARIPENKLRPRLEPTRRAVALLGDPQRSYRVIHLTGTNGKTSTTRFVERLLREHGLRTGRFTSPHLVKLNERIAIDGEPVEDQMLWEVYQDIEPVLDMVDAELVAEGDTRLTFFEALAVLGFAVFAEATVDVLVLEVGMGGEWDSTNVADGDVAVFTPISLDHMDRLGNTVAEIAATKSGIIKPNSIVVSSEQTSDALPVLEAKASSTAEDFKLLGRDARVISAEVVPGGQRISVQGLAATYRDLFMPLYGEFQAENLATAIMAVEAFLGGGEREIPDDVIRVAVADMSSPGRLQIVSTDPLTILDGAHNPGGAKSLAQALATHFDAPKTIGIIGVLGEKDAAATLAPLAKSFDHVIVAASSSPRAVEADELAKVAATVFGAENLSVAESVADAYEIAQTMVFEGGAIVVTGSLSMVGDMLKLVQTEMEEDDEA
jgi:dihydrofolate synthase/folylpolyglutamate synthase